MSTLEKFGILVILILVVVIGVVAVWGVGGEEGTSPFDQGNGNVAVVDPPQDAGGGAGELPPWPGSGGASAVVNPVPSGPVEPPAVDTPVTPPGVPGPVADRPGPRPEPAPVSGTTYTVRKGDTLTKIAAATLGDGSKWQLLVDANPGLDPRRMKIGQVLTIPGGSSAMASLPPKTDGAAKPRVKSFAVNPEDGPSVLPSNIEVREVEVRKGDSFYSLAVTHLGDGSKWRSILKANPGLGEKDLRPGMRVKLPAAE